MENKVPKLWIIKCRQLWKIVYRLHVYVEAAYDNSGNELTKSYEAENGTATAVVFSVKVAPDEVDQMNTAISYEGIQLYLAGK